MERFVIKSSFDSQDLHCVDFCDEIENPKIVLQLCHGMQEHILRYESFGKFLGENGIKVVGMDNRGHGKTGDSMGILGHTDDKCGYDKLPEDVNDLNRFLNRQYPNSKLFIFGHSMGSIITRNFLNKYSNNVVGAIICGTTGLFDVTHNLGLRLANFMCKFSGVRKKVGFINKMPFKNHNSKIENSITAVDWLTRDEVEVQKYLNDEYCGFPCTNGFYRDLLTMVKNMSVRENVKNVRKDLPIFVVSGDKDPVGIYGKGVTASYEFYKNIGIEKISLKLYKGMRHEILNEIGKEEVYLDILNFIKRVDEEK